MDNVMVRLVLAKLVKKAFMVILLAIKSVVQTALMVNVMIRLEFAINVNPSTMVINVIRRVIVMGYVKGVLEYVLISYVKRTNIKMLSTNALIVLRTVKEIVILSVV